MIWNGVNNSFTGADSATSGAPGDHRLPGKSLKFWQLRPLLWRRWGSLITEGVTFPKEL